MDYNSDIIGLNIFKPTIFAPLFISAQPEALGAEQKALIKQCFAKAAKVQPIGEPLDWLTNPLPAKWKLNGREVDFDWE